MTEKETLAELRKLELKNGDVLLLHMRGITNDDLVKSVAFVYQEFNRAGLDKVGFLLCKDNVNIEALDEKQLNEAGWYKKETENRGYKYL
jgi:hypothetical protein